MEVENQCAIIDSRGIQTVNKKAMMDMMDVDVVQQKISQLSVPLSPIPTTTTEITKTTTPTVSTESTTLSIPENILSPPKSDTQTDDTNTATSSSPTSDVQMSPTEKQHTLEPLSMPKVELSTSGQNTTPPNNTTKGKAAKHEKKETQAKKAGVALPKTGKPFNAVLNAADKLSRMVPRKQKGTVYESEISDNKIGIKLCIKKPQTTATASSSVNSKKRIRKSSKSAGVSKHEPEIKRNKKDKAASNNSAEGKKSVSFASGVKDNEDKQPLEQSMWGSKLPEVVLYQVNCFHIYTLG